MVQEVTQLAQSAQFYVYNILIGVAILLIGFSLGFLSKKLFHRLFTEIKLNQILRKINFNQDKALLEKEFFTVCNINQQIIKENFIIVIAKNSEVKLGIESDEVTCALSQTTAKNNPNYPICTTTFLNDFRITTGSKQQAQKQIT